MRIKYENYSVYYSREIEDCLVEALRIGLKKSKNF